MRVSIRNVHVSRKLFSCFRDCYFYGLLFLMSLKHFSLLTIKIGSRSLVENSGKMDSKQ